MDSELDGTWAAAEADDDLRRRFPSLDFDDSAWAKVRVPGHWRAEADFSASDGPILYRRMFEGPALEEGQRAWVVMEGAFYQSDVWLDGSYLGDTEGYFFPHSFDATALLRARPEHVLAVEVACERPARAHGKRAFTGVWSDESCIDPSYNPGGIWAPVRLATTGPVRVSSLRVACTEATPERAVLELSAVLDSAGRLTVNLATEVRAAGAGQGGDEAAKGAAEGGGTVAEGGGTVARADTQQPLAIGRNTVRWRLEVPKPRLWWPSGLGEQALYEVRVAVAHEGEQSDSRRLRTGLRQVRAHDLRFFVNGESLFLKGANLMPTRRDLAYASAGEVARDVHIARDAGLNLLRVHAHVGRPELYEVADELGVLLWQDMPLHGSYRGARRQAVRQAGKAVDLLSHHPSVVVWCCHNEPFPFGPTGTGWRPARSVLRVAAQALPNPYRSLLDQSTRRAFERSDSSRPVVPSSGVLPHLARASASHLYFGWYHGEPRDLARAAKLWPATTRFVSELGAQAVPEGDGPVGEHDWPQLPWDDLVHHFCLQKGVFDRRVPPAGYSSYQAWREATQAYQAELLRCQVEALRKLRHRPTGGFAVHFLNDSQPAVSASLLDSERRPKQALASLAGACAPVLVVADWPAASYAPGAELSFDVHVVNDTREALRDAVLEARVAWPGGGRVWRVAGDADALGCTFVKNFRLFLPGEAAFSQAGAPSRDAGPEAERLPLCIELELRWGEDGSSRSVRNHYRSWATRSR